MRSSLFEGLMIEFLERVESMRKFELGKGVGFAFLD